MSDKKIKPLKFDKKILNKLTKQQQKDLKSLADEITKEAIKVKKDYEENKSNLSGSLLHVHENSPALDSDDNGEPTYSGSRWRRVLKSF